MGILASESTCAVNMAFNTVLGKHLAREGPLAYFYAMHGMRNAVEIRRNSSAFFPCKRLPTGILKAIDISRSRRFRSLPTGNNTAEGKQAV